MAWERRFSEIGWMPVGDVEPSQLDNIQQVFERFLGTQRR